MIYLGLDASTTKTGYAIFDDDKLIEYGCIKPKSTLHWRERIAKMGEEIATIIGRFDVDEIIIEDVPLMEKKKVPNQKVSMMLGAVQGMVVTISSQLKVPVVYKLPSQWRSPLDLFDGTRNGTKRDEMKQKSIKLANKLFGLQLEWHSPSSTKNDDDISDAILVAYSYIKEKIKGF